MEKKNVVTEIAAHLESLMSVKAVHSPGTYGDTLTSEASSTWGWVEPLQFKGYSVVWHRFSPGRQGESGGLVFDFKGI